MTDNESNNKPDNKKLNKQTDTPLSKSVSSSESPNPDYNPNNPDEKPENESDKSSNRSNNKTDNKSEEKYKCAVDGCNKSFDNENSIRMHSLKSHESKTAWEEGGTPPDKENKGKETEKSSEEIEEPEDVEPGLAKSSVEKLVTELKDNMETFNIPSGGEKGKKQREKILTVLRKAPSYRDWNHVYNLLEMVGTDPSDAKTICDMTFSRVSQENLKQAQAQAPEITPNQGGDMNPSISNPSTGNPTSGNNPNEVIEKMKELEEKAEDAGMDLDETIDSIMDYQMKLQILNSLQNGGVFGGQSKEDELKEMMMNQNSDSSVTKEDLQNFKKETVQEVMNQLKEEEKEDKLTQALEKFSKRLSSLEQRMSNPTQGGNNPTNAKSDLENVREQVSTVREIVDEIEGDGGGERDKQLAQIVTDELKDLRTTMPSGDRNEYDMEVEKAKLKSEAEKAKAEAEEKKYVHLSKALEEGLGNLGWNLGDRMAGEGGQMPQQNTNPNPNPSNQLEMKQQKVKEKDGERVVDCPYGCGAEIEIPHGQARTTCPNCGRQVVINEGKDFRGEFPDSNKTETEESTTDETESESSTEEESEEES